MGVCQESRHPPLLWIQMGVNRQRKGPAIEQPWKSQEVPQALFQLAGDTQCLKIPIKLKKGKDKRGKQCCLTLRYLISSSQDCQLWCLGLINFLFRSQQTLAGFCLLLSSRHLHALIHDKWFHLMHIGFPCLPTRKIIEIPREAKLKLKESSICWRT